MEISKRAKRKFSKSQKLEILSKIKNLGDASKVAALHGLHVSQVSRWKRELKLQLDGKSVTSQETKSDAGTT
jgi:transposase-like protein